MFDCSGSGSQDSADKNCNAAYSPLGYSAILAALAEGASGKTRAQMLAALKLPQDSSLTRATYRSVLSRMRVRCWWGRGFESTSLVAFL